MTELWPAGAVGAAPEGAPLACEGPLRTVLPRADGVYEDVFAGAGPLRVDAAPLVHPVQSLGYVLTEAERPGALDARRAAALGVRGKDLGRLKAGEDVQGTGADGAPCVVRAADCVGAPTPGRRLLLLGDTCDSSAVLRLERRGFVAVVHESTFDDASAALAAPRGHSTARMAGAFAAAVGASTLVLTHFSQVRQGTCSACWMAAGGPTRATPAQRFRPRSKDAAAAAVMDAIVAQALAGYVEAGSTDTVDAAAEAATAISPPPRGLSCVAVEDFSLVDLRPVAAVAAAATAAAAAAARVAGCGCAAASAM